MLGDPAKRQLFAETQLRSMALHDRFRQEAFRVEPAPTKRIAWITRPIAAMAAGLVIGLFSASVVWAISSPKATTERLFSLINGSFDEDRLEVGFPHQTGVWSGDAASIANGKLRFIAPGSDSNDPSAQAISCDVFQLVDLRPLRHTLSQEGESVLELSAIFLDARPRNTKPSVTFFCQLYLFQGRSLRHCIKAGRRASPTLSPAAAPKSPHSGRMPKERAPLPRSASCLQRLILPSSKSPRVRICHSAKLESLFADDVKLTLKTSPELPIRIVQR